MASSSGNVQALAGSSRSTTTAEAAQNVSLLDQPLYAEPEAGSSRRQYADGDTQDQLQDLDDYDNSATPTPTHRSKSHSLVVPSMHPRFSRALSMPLASQLAHLHHPHRLNGSIVPESLEEANSTELSQFRELSLELGDSVQVMIQTMLHVSPPHIFDPAKEQVSACALSVPAPSMSAMFTALKNLNYISANMSTFLLSDSSDLHIPSTLHHNDFDIGETLQSVGDVLSGVASQSGVELVLYHADVGLKHIGVKGDESGISYLLSHVVRQIISTARRGDSIELGLLVLAASSKPTLDSQVTDSPVDLDSLLCCTIQVSHKYSLTNYDPNTDPRTCPNFSSLLLRRLIRKVDAKLSLDTAAESSTEWACELSFTLERDTSPGITPPLPEFDERQAVEPTIEQLTSFVETLKGKKVTLYASSKGSFANHLTSYLTAWGLDVSHGDADGTDSEGSSPATTTSVKLPGPQPESPSFIFIDDDVTVLKQRLNALRMEHPQFNLRKRPSLAPHRNVSSTQITRQKQYTSSSIVLVHFASLCNFKIIRDVIQSILPSYMGSLISVPEIMIIPKPAGPRRLLTALHTALTKPVVDPFFSPIATSPGSPSVVSGGSFMSAHSNTSSPKSPLPHRPSGSRSDSDRSTRSAKDNQDPNPPPPSPLGMPDNVEYFTQTIGVSPSSGYVIQSPDGKTTGIYFHPNSKSGPPRLPSGTTDKSIITSNLPTNRSPIQNNSPITFSSLHEASQSRSPSSPAVTTAVRTPPIDPNRSPSALRKTSPVIPSSSEVKTIPPLLKSLGRRTTSNSSSKTQNTSPNNKKAKNPDETKIVPPVSVLIVDDNPINQTILSTFMKKKKIKYDVASNGAEAVQKWRSGEFHLILMDIQMPIMDGIDATKEIRRLERAFAMEGYISEDHQSASPLGTPSESSEPKPSPHRTSVIIVALTASSLQSDRVAALAAGCNDFLTKPVHLPWLNNKIIEWGSIKALQMWADRGREILDSQTAQAQTVAERLHVPPRKSPSLAHRFVDTPSSPAPPDSALSVASSTWMNGQASPGYTAGSPAQEKPAGPDPDSTPPNSPGPH